MKISSLPVVEFGLAVRYPHVAGRMTQFFMRRVDIQIILLRCSIAAASILA